MTSSGWYFLFILFGEAILQIYCDVFGLKNPKDFPILFYFHCLRWLGCTQDKHLYFEECFLMNYKSQLTVLFLTFFYDFTF